MDTELFDRWAELTQNAWKPFVELGEITTRSLERAGRRQLDLLQDSLQEGARIGQSVAEVKDLQALYTLQTQLLSEYGEKLFTLTKENLELYVETGNELGKWFQSGLPTPPKPAARSRKAAA